MVNDHFYSFQGFLDLLIGMESQYDEGFPGPEFYTRDQLTDLVLEAVDEFARWHCASCGVNTMAIDEYYMVERALWKAHGVDTGMLCIGCLEDRLGRRLHCADFTDAPINRADIFGQSVRLRARLAAKAV